MPSAIKDNTMEEISIEEGVTAKLRQVEGRPKITRSRGMRSEEVDTLIAALEDTAKSDKWNTLEGVTSAEKDKAGRKVRYAARIATEMRKRDGKPELLVRTQYQNEDSATDEYPMGLYFQGYEADESSPRPRRGRPRKDATAS